MASHVLSGECFQLLVESDLQRIKTALKKKGVQACFLTGHRRILCQTLISCCCQLSFERRKLQCAILAHKVQLFSLMFLFLIKKVNETHLVCIIICSGESCKVDCMYQCIKSNKRAEKFSSQCYFVFHIKRQLINRIFIIHLDNKMKLLHNMACVLKSAAYTVRFGNIVWFSLNYHEITT